MAKDDVLISRARAGDERAFTDLVRNYHAYVYAVVSAVLENPDDAEEVVQDTFINVYRNLPQLKDAASFNGWLTEIARNCARDRLRKRKLETVPIDEVRPHTLETSDAADVRLIRDEQIELIRGAMGALSQKDREIARAYYLDGASYDELIRTHGLSYKAISFRLSRAKRILKKRLKHLLSGVFLPPATTLKKISSGGFTAMKIGTVPKITIGVIAILALAFIGSRQLLSPEKDSASSAKALAPTDGKPAASGAEVNAARENKTAESSLETEPEFSAEEMEQIEDFFAELDAADEQVDELLPVDIDEHSRNESEAFDTDDEQSPVDVMNAYVEAYKNANFEALLPLVTGTAREGIEGTLRMFSGEMPEEILNEAADLLSETMSEEEISNGMAMYREMIQGPEVRAMMQEMYGRTEIVSSGYVGEEFHFKLRTPMPEMPELPDMSELSGMLEFEMPEIPKHIDSFHKMRKQEGEWLIYDTISLE
ncbi:MAG: RNA polymerase sigma factor [Candidatus Poribacteria bacterium]|nr:RNA polymerase sigma factor [Candidatus Poribacteria bacterium]